MPIYAGLEPPKFSEGWLSRWKARYNVKKHSLHGEAGSVQLGQEDTEMMRQIQTILAAYDGVISTTWMKLGSSGGRHLILH